jgi:nicotinamidase-related amidase
MVRGRNTAVLLVDVINPFDFPGSERLLEHARAVLPALLRLRRAAHRAGVPVIYANDNFGDWRSESSRIVTRCAKGPGRRFVQALKPLARDYFVLKARNSAFFCTALPPLLEELRVQRLIVAGLSTDNCVLFTAHDAYLRGFKVAVPHDCVAAQSEADTERALAQMKCAVKADTRASRSLGFVRGKA